MKKHIRKLLVVMAIILSPTANAQVVFDPVHWLETFLQALADNAAWGTDYALSEYRNLASSASNSAELTEVLSQLRNSEADQSTIDAVKALVSFYTLGTVDLGIDIGEIEINEDILIEVMTEKLAEEMQYQQAASSRMGGVGQVIKDRYPELPFLMQGGNQERFYSDSNGYKSQLSDLAITTQYDSGVATLNANTALIEGLKDSDELLKEVREDVLSEDLGTNALLRRVMKVGLVSAENTRAVAEVLIAQTDLQAQKMAIDASGKAAARAEISGASKITQTIADGEVNRVRNSDDPRYWTKDYAN